MVRSLLPICGTIVIAHLWREPYFRQLSHESDWPGSQPAKGFCALVSNFEQVRLFIGSWELRV